MGKINLVTKIHKTVLDVWDFSLEMRIYLFIAK